jgi:hypothetical protein
VQRAFTRRAIPPRRYVERLATLARQEEERFGAYIAPLLTRQQGDLEHKRREVTDLTGRDFLRHGFDAVDQAVGRLAEETAHLVSDRGPLPLLQEQLETRLTSQLRELERVTQGLRTLVARCLTPLGVRRRRRALQLTQEVTTIKLTLLLCRRLWREESMFRDFITWIEAQRSRLRAIQNGLMPRMHELARERHELAAYSEVTERAGRGLSLTEALAAHNHSLEDYYHHAALSPEALARDVVARQATAESAAVLAFLRAEALRQGHRAVEPLSLLGTLSQLEPALRRKLLTACVQASQVQMRIDPAVYAAREFLPVMTRVCVVPGGQDSPLATWLREVSAEPWEFVCRDTDEEILFLTLGHRILPEALIGYRLLKDAYERLPRKEWVHVLHPVAPAPATPSPAPPASGHAVPTALAAPLWPGETVEDDGFEPVERPGTPLSEIMPAARR